MFPRAMDAKRNRNVIEVWSQSNGNGGSWPATTLPNPLERHRQRNVLWSRWSRYNGANPEEIDTDWGPMYCPNGPGTSFGASGIPAMGLVQPLAHSLAWLPRLAILQCGYGATDSGYWSAYYSSTYAPWCAERVAQIPYSTGRAMVIYQGESNALANTASLWRGHWEPIIAARRAIWNKPTMPLIVVRLPNTCPVAHLAEMQAAQAELVAADANAVLVTDNTATMGAGPDNDSVSTWRIARIIGAAIALKLST